VEKVTAGYLVLDTGHVFEGIRIGADKEPEGELVFNTAMTGYQEMMTDPSYKGQILTFTYPMIGNYGWNNIDDESERPAAEGVIINDDCHEPNHHESAGTIHDYLVSHGVAGLAGVDTRALVKIIRKSETVRARIVSTLSEAEEFRSGASSEIQLVAEVSTKEVRHYSEGEGAHVVLFDYGSKASIPQALKKAGCRVSIVPFDTTLETVKQLNPDGILFSNGPGDPQALREYLLEIYNITMEFPCLGVCLGHQLMALAHGAETEKMPFGHRGSNHPVKHLSTGKVSMTSQNHGYVIREKTLGDTGFEPLFVNVNDKTVEGIQHKFLPLQSVQFHPEAHPGPSDTAYIFDEFVQSLSTGGKKLCRTVSV
jgi:carbamoyl-phosphate synthase small subunit